MSAFGEGAGLLALRIAPDRRMLREARSMLAHKQVTMTVIALGTLVAVS